MEEDHADVTIFKRHMKMIVGNGKNIRYRWDPWLDSGSICKNADDDLPFWVGVSKDILVVVLYSSGTFV